MTAARENHDTDILNLVFVKVPNAVDDHPWNSAPEVDHLMHHKGHDARSKDIILHRRIPGCPQALEDVQVYIIFGDLVKMGQVGRRRW